MGKGSRVMWQIEGAQGITSVKILLNKSFFPPNLSMFHSHWGFCNLEISTVYVKRRLLLGRKVMTNLDSIFKGRDIILPTKVRLVKAMVFPVVIYGCELDYKESLVQKNWCFGTVVLEKTLESPLDCKEIQPVHPKGDQSWVFIGRSHAEAETPILQPSDAESWLIWKDSDAGKDWGQEKGQQRMRWLEGIIDSMDMIWANCRIQWRTGKPGMLYSMV